MKIISHETAKSDAFEIRYEGGARDGMVFTAVDAKLADGSKAGAFVCNARDGYFRQVFVPFDFESDNLI